MKPSYTEDEFKKAKSRDKLPVQCEHCGKIFHPVKHDILSHLSGTRDSPSRYCSSRCYRQFIDPPIIVTCAQCNTYFKKKNSQIKRSKSGNHFCSRSCAATWNNAHKKHGTRRSKLEKWLEEQLTALYPNLEIHFNRKDAIQSELDIFIPSLMLAFELNGIFHYEPIYGQDKLNSVQSNDHRKFAACYEAKISLCFIDISHQKYFKPKSSQKFLDIITDIIDTRLSDS